MNYLSVLLLVSVVGSTSAWASTELDSEVNDLQVRIVRLQPKPKVKPMAQPVAQTPISPKIYTYNAAPPKIQTKQRAKTLYAASPVVAATSVRSVSTPAIQTVSAPVMQQPVIQQPMAPRAVSQRVAINDFQPTSGVAEDNGPAPQVTSKTASEQPNYEAKFIRRFELGLGFSASSFDGSDSSNLIPSGVSSPFTSSFLNASLRTDVDLGFAPLYLELGLTMNQIGSTTGAPNSNLNRPVQGVAYQEEVTLTYFEVPVNVKWRLAPQEMSSLYIKAGLIPAFMVSHNYQSSTPVSDEFRFGAYNTFDIMVDGGLGYDIKFSKHIHALVEVSVFQGLMPVMTNYSVYNYGLLTGIGLAYLL